MYTGEELAMHDHYAGSARSAPIYVITPTYLHLAQIPDMTRLANLLALIPSMHWIVVSVSIEISNLNSLLFSFTAPLASSLRKSQRNMEWVKGWQPVVFIFDGKTCSG
jgi:hypothetical protein